MHRGILFYCFNRYNGLRRIEGSDILLMKKEIKLILNSTNDAMIAVDKEGYITLFNKAAEELTKIRSSNAIGKYIKEVIHTTRLPIILETGIPEFNKRQILRDIEIITNRIPLIDDENEILGAVAIFRDITEMLSLAEEITNLKEIQGTLEAVFNSTQDAISVVNQHGIHVMINPAYTRITGLTESDVIGKDFTVDLVEGKSVHQQVLQEKKAVDSVVLRSGHQKKEVIASAAPLIVNGELRGSVAVIHDISEIRQLSYELDQAKQIIRTLEAKYTFEDIKGNNIKLNEAISKAEIAALTPATVILRGESGTGKELFAHAIHNASNRKNAQFVRVNCAAISQSLLESELFGYDEGAFTGAMKGGKVGLFERADGGTIFLDEIGEINLNTQAKLLRVLQEKEIVRVGGTKSIPVDVRVISATNLDLEKAVDEGVFRKDLYYRLNVIPIRIPPLRDRKDDLGKIIEHLIRKYNQEYGRNVTSISSDALLQISKYNWPGNIRELENYIGRAMINMKIIEQVIQMDHLPQINDSEENVIIPLQKDYEKNELTVMPLGDVTGQFEKEYILRVLIQNRFNKTLTAKQLKVSIRSLYYKIEKYGIDENLTC